MQTPPVAIIVVNWNGADDTIACVTSLQSLAYPNYKIIVVDNASTDDSAERIEQRFGSAIDLIRNPINDGYAQGNNVGIAHALQKYAPSFFWVLNNDATVEPGTLPALIERATKPDTPGLVGSLIRYSDSETVYCLGGGILNTWTGIDRLLGAKLPLAKAYTPSHLSYVAGCSLFLSARVYSATGGFDPDYFLYSEEADLCLRATRAGFRIAYAPAAIVHHQSSKSTGYYSTTYIYYFLRNKLVFMKKNAAPWQYPTYLLVFFFYYCLGFLWKAWSLTRLPPSRSS
ncbi:MAG: glycosyltransferase family 2 protein [bacterium]